MNPIEIFLLFCKDLFVGYPETRQEGDNVAIQSAKSIWLGVVHDRKCDVVRGSEFLHAFAKCSKMFPFGVELRMKHQHAFVPEVTTQEILSFVAGEVKFRVRTEFGKHKECSKRS